MPVRLQGSCRCGAVRFTLDSHTPYPYQLCYCSICRKTAGGGGYAINIMGDAATLAIEGRDAIEIYQAEIRDENGTCRTSSGERNFCRHCGTALWLWDENWPDLVHPLASVIDTAPANSARAHASDAAIQGGLGDARFRARGQTIRALPRPVHRRLAPVTKPLDRVILPVSSRSHHSEPYSSSGFSWYFSSFFGSASSCFGFGGSTVAFTVLDTLR